MREWENVNQNKYCAWMIDDECEDTSFIHFHFLFLRDHTHWVLCDVPNNSYQLLSHRGRNRNIWSRKYTFIVFDIRNVILFLFCFFSFFLFRFQRNWGWDSRLDVLSHKICVQILYKWVLYAWNFFVTFVAALVLFKTVHTF